ncbi:hypothetical protein GCM10010252_76910 [Streptomyces aureoverticillatus]|nr:hypothetical protein GCM10010252_76910 [Streptomyces aureoverticillatus]
MHATPHIVSDVMPRTVVALGREATFKDIVKTMQQWKVSALPVPEAGSRGVGIVSEADLLPKEEFRDNDPDRPTQARHLSDLAKAGALTAEALMTAPAVTVHGNDTLAQAARIMARAKIKRLPVVDDEGVLHGIVSRVDLLKVFLRDDDIAEEVRRQIVARTFPRPPNRFGWTCATAWSLSAAASRTPCSCPSLLAWCEPSRAWWTSTALMVPHRHPDLGPDLRGGGGTRRASGAGHAS